MTPLVDLHAHVLCGVDDGPATIDGTVALLRALHAEGVGIVYATPHVQPDPYPTSAGARDAALEAARTAAAAAGVAILIEPGGEVDLEYAAGWSDAELRRFTLGGGRAILIEFPWGGAWPLGLAPTCAALRRRGFLPVVAHPERARVVQHDPDRLREVTSTGAVCQLTAASLAGVFGDAPRTAAFGLLDRGLAHLVSSDAHNATTRGPRLRDCRRAVAMVYGDAYSDALMGAAALVAAEQTPPLLAAERVARKRRFGRPAP